jgi:hypothetical protein
MEYARQFVFASSALRLTPGQWLATGVFLAVVLVAVPVLARRLERFEPGPDYRLPYDFSQDYWHCARWLEEAARREAVLVMGDSVVWGEYVAAADTLSGQLNRLTGGERFANLGVNGLHPVALQGLVRHLGGAVRNRDVVLVLNLLWLSSPRHDLRQAAGPGEDAQAVLNHPALLPQFWPRVPRYQASFEERIGNLVERHLPFLVWVSHLNATGAYAAALVAESAEEVGADAASGQGLEPRIDHPAPAPYRGLFVGVPPPAPGPHGQPVTWETRGIPVSRIDWPAAGESLQWRFFRRAMLSLRARGNRVCVLVAPFNPYVQDEDSRAGYEGLVGEVVAWLDAQEGIAVIRAEPLPGTEYADASHPLAAGYARLARELAADPRFGPWLRAGKAGPSEQQ